MAKNNKAYSYTRFSHPDQAKGDSVRRQTQMAADYAARHGLDLDESLTFQDLAVSAFHGRNIQAGKLGEFLEAVRTGAVEQGSHLLVESLDRISRDQIVPAQTLFLMIIQSGVTLHTLVDGKVYSLASVNANPTDLIMSIVILMRAHEESATKAKRLRASWENKRANIATKPLTSRCPAWLRLDGDKFTVIERRATIVRRIYSDTLKGIGQHTIAERLNREGVPVFGDGGRRGAHWHRSYVVKILDSAAVVGTLVPHVQTFDGQKKTRKPLAPVDGYYPAVIDLDTYQRVRAMREGTKAPRRGRHAHQPVQNLLGGLARCPDCGATMTRVMKGRNNGAPRLVCTAAKAGARGAQHYHAINYGDVERTIVERRHQLIASAPAASTTVEEIDRQLSNLDGQLDELAEQAERLLDALSRKPSAAVANRLAKLEADMDTKRATVEELTKQRRVANGPNLRARLSELELVLGDTPLDRAKANAQLRSILRGVVIDHQRGQLTLEWQHGGHSELTYSWPGSDVSDLKPVRRRSRA